MDLAAAQDAYARREWASAYRLLAEADAVLPLGVADLERLAEAADLTGHSAEVVPVLRRAFHLRCDGGQIAEALRTGYWLCKALAWAGDAAQAGAWQARLHRIAEEHPDCPHRAYVLMLDGEQQDRSGAAPEQLLAIARELRRLADACADPDITAMATMALGMARIRAGAIAAGLACLDDAMVAVTADGVSGRATGMIYCTTISVCSGLHEWRRAREWTAALDAICAAQPDFTGAYRGLCRVHRVAILQLGGAWPTAVREARLACEQLTGGYGQMVAGSAFYQLAELHRVRGAAGDAERAYRAAARYGADPQPGMALLRLAQGRPDTAAAAIRRALAEPGDAAQLGKLLPAAVEVLLAVGDQAGARAAADELAALVERFDTPTLRALAEQSDAAVRLAEGDAGGALPGLRRAFRLWRDIDAPHEAARSRVLVAQAYRVLGDDDSAELELHAAREVFTQLGAAPDLARLDGARSSVLTPRELEVLRLVAAGRTNHAIAAELVLSEKTVARHVSNILAKLGVGSRTAAAAYAFERGLATT